MTTPLFNPVDMKPLSAREQEVFTLLIHGLSYREISERLGIGFNTVHTHLGRIYKKLGVRSRSQAAAKILMINSRAPFHLPPSHASVIKSPA